MKEKFLKKILNERFKAQGNTQNVNQKLELLEDNHIELINPICPYCNSKTDYKTRI